MSDFKKKHLLFTAAALVYTCTAKVQAEQLPSAYENLKAKQSVAAVLGDINRLSVPELATKQPSALQATFVLGPKVLPDAVISFRENQADASNGPLNLLLKHRLVDSDVPEMRQYEVMPNIYFGFNQHVPQLSSAQDMLQKIKVFLQQEPAAVLKIVGHADEMGSKSDNLSVSQKRAQSVKEYFVKQGIAPERMLVHFRGEEEPLASNDDEREGRALNRRVSFYLLMPLTK